MRIHRFYFFFAALAAVAAASLALATTYTDNYCQPTPYSACPSPCGCPTSTVQDVCSAVLPTPDSSSTTNYFCIAFPGFQCTAPGRSCGDRVYLCDDCFNCGAACCQNQAVIHCNQSAKDKKGFCQNHSFGCSTP